MGCVGGGVAGVQARVKAAAATAAAAGTALQPWRTLLIALTVPLNREASVGPQLSALLVLAAASAAGAGMGCCQGAGMGCRAGTGIGHAPGEGCPRFRLG